MLFQHWAMPVQCSGSSGLSLSDTSGGGTSIQRLRTVSQEIRSTCRRAISLAGMSAGRSNSTMYCCSGRMPNVYLISKVGQLTVGAFGANHELRPIAVHSRRHAMQRDLRVGKVAQHRLVRGRFHRPIVIGARSTPPTSIAWHSTQLSRPT